MLTFIFLILGLAVGGICVFLLLFNMRRSIRVRMRQLNSKLKKLNTDSLSLKVREQKLSEESKNVKILKSDYESKKITYNELQNENLILKHDLQNIDINLRKLQLDRDYQSEYQNILDQKSSEIANRYLNENVKWISSSINQNNYANCKKRLLKVIELCRGIGFDVPIEEENTLLDNLKEEFELAVRAALEREEQMRIKAQIREEQKLEKEIEQELKRLDREKAAIRAALDKALAEAEDQHSEEIELLKTKLAEAEEKSQRAISQAQLTKSGHVYVISNLGSFGEDVYKIGMTRRLEPTDRVRELGSASVPFPFDVHMMVSSDNAPALENAIHKSLHSNQLNKVNPRKEFFKTDIETIYDIIKEHHGDIVYQANAEALQYYQSLEMSDEDLEYVESVYDKIDVEDDIE